MTKRAIASTCARWGNADTPLEFFHKMDRLDSIHQMGFDRPAAANFVKRPGPEKLVQTLNAI